MSLLKKSFNKKINSEMKLFSISHSPRLQCEETNRGIHKMYSTGTRNITLKKNLLLSDVVANCYIAGMMGECKWIREGCAMTGCSFIPSVSVQLWRIGSHYQGLHYLKWIEHSLWWVSLPKHGDPISDCALEPIQSASLWKTVLNTNREQSRCQRVSMMS